MHAASTSVERGETKERREGGLSSFVHAANNSTRVREGQGSGGSCEIPVHCVQGASPLLPCRP